MHNTTPVIPGIGDVDDLQVKFHENTRGRWFPQLQSGTFYLGGREYYLYAKEGHEDVIIPHGLNTLVLSTTADLLTAAKNGPIILDGEWYRYMRSTNCFTAMASITPSGTTLLSATIPGELVILTSAAGKDMHSVPSSGYLVDRDYYYWDSSNRTVYVARDASDPDKSETLYASYLEDAPKLLQEELLFVDTDGLLRTTFGRVLYGASGTVFDPVIIDTTLGTVSASAVLDNVIHPSQQLTPGNRVAVRYYVDKSFIASLSGTNLTITTLSSGVDNATLRWEDAYIYSFWDAGTYPASSLSYVQLNPTLTGCSQGFLYIDMERHPAETLSSLSMYSSPIRICNASRQTTRITVVARDRDNLPLPRIPVTCWVTKDGVDYTTTSTDLDYPLYSTDFNGECHFSFTADPLYFGTYTIMASAMTASSQTIISSGLLDIVDPIYLTDASDSAKVFLYLNPNKDSQGLRDLYVYLTDQSGIPLLESLDVLVKCNYGMLFQTTTLSSTGQTAGTQSLILDFGESDNLIGLRVATCKYKAVSGDEIIGIPQDTATTSLYKFASTPLKVTIDA